MKQSKKLTKTEKEYWDAKVYSYNQGKRDGEQELIDKFIDLLQLYDKFERIKEGD